MSSAAVVIGTLRVTIFSVINTHALEQAQKWLLVKSNFISGKSRNLLIKSRNLMIKSRNDY